MGLRPGSSSNHQGAPTRESGSASLLLLTSHTQQLAARAAVLVHSPPAQHLLPLLKLQNAPIKAPALPSIATWVFFTHQAETHTLWLPPALSAVSSTFLHHSTAG